MKNSSRSEVNNDCHILKRWDNLIAAKAYERKYGNQIYWFKAKLIWPSF